MTTKTQAQTDALSKVAHDLAFVDSVTVGERGQVAIPAELRRQLDVAGGAKLFVLRLEGTQGFVVLTAAGLVELARTAPTAVLARVFQIENGGGKRD